jgi:hypothetical protein
MSGNFLRLCAILFIVGATATAVRHMQCESARPDPAPEVLPAPVEPDHSGWSPQAVADLSPWADELGRFCICARDGGQPVWQDNSRANVRLWKLTALLVGQPPPNGPQLTGDCTSWSSAHAIEATQSGQIAAVGGAWQRIFPAWSYGVGRQWVWRKDIVGRMPSQGCSVGAVLRGAVEFGVVSWDEAEAAGYKYSGQLADQWGNSGPPEKLKPLAAQHKLGAIAQLKSAADLCNAVCNGYGTAFGSDFTGGNFRTKDGRIVADNIAPRLAMKERWHHALCCDGFDGSTGTAYYHIQNSWYPESHPKPIDDSPPCGFWVEESSIAYIVAQGDAWATSDFTGFVERRDDIDLFRVTFSPHASGVGENDVTRPKSAHAAGVGAKQSSKTRMSP